MENQDDVSCVDLLQIRGHTRKIEKEIGLQKIKTKIMDFLIKLLQERMFSIIIQLTQKSVNRKRKS
jgi:hypothetical protein